MKRKLILPLLSVLLIAALLSGCGKAEPVSPSSPSDIKVTPLPASGSDLSSPPPLPASPTDLEGLITEDEALGIALENAGFAEKDVTGIKVILDTDEKRPEYDIEFFKDKVEYDYEIDAETGVILSSEQERVK